ncbi:MAG: tetratricopeptide repeat protein [Acidobacteria bacterium]|nr:tetratricopeptide repeat protein [Acidobacteriota bacterium]
MTPRQLLAIFVLAGPASLVAQQNQLDFNPSLFSVMAAINAAGYDADIQSPSNHPFRHDLRKHFAAKNLPVVAELKRFYRDHKQDSDAQTLSQYVSFALVTDGPPNFKYRFRSNEIPPEVTALEGLQDLMKRFHQEAQIDAIWKQVQPLFECQIGGCKLKDGTAIEGYHDPVVRTVQETNAYLRIPSSGGERYRFQIFLDLLAAPNQVIAKSFGDEFYVVVTHSPQPSVDAIRHYFVQYSVAPLVMRQQEVLETKKGLGDFAIPAPLLPDIYKKDFVLLTEKSFVKAIESRLVTGPGSTARRQQMVEQALGEGYILTPYFAEALAGYEKQEQSMRFFFKEMATGIDLRKEDKRLEGVQFATKAVTRTIKAPTPAAPTKTAIEQALDDAEDLLTGQKLEESRTKFLDILRLTDAKPVHAKAYYGLARVAIRQNDPELGERLFQKTLELEPDDSVKAWSLVYLGRLADIAGENDKAKQQYQAALAVAGISEKARETAQKGMAGEFRRKQQ